MVELCSNNSHKKEQKMTLKTSFTIVFTLLTLICLAQLQTIKGKVIDESSGLPIPFSNVFLMSTDPVLGTTSDENGDFLIETVPIGRYDIQASFVGYESTIKKDIEVSSSKTVYLVVALKESFKTLKEIVVKPNVDKEYAQNTMALISARMLSVEESSRYAGGFDDPARLAASFAGVSSGVNNNGIVVRGNAPKSLQWKLEGIEIPNPNHFADLASFGGGALTALSSQLLSNSDFLTGAFPSEYSNALSGVFDIKMRKGNNEEREYTIQLGALGIDVSSEGPFRKGKAASYLFNYRYSTFGLVGQITGAEEGIKYQDLSFKLNFPTKKAGVFSFWGIGLLDGFLTTENSDTTNWRYRTDGERYDADLYMVASGIKNKLVLGERSYLQTTVGFTTNDTDWQVSQLDTTLTLQPESNLVTTNSTYILTSTLNTKFNKKHTNRIGVQATRLGYKTLLQNRVPSADFETVVNENGSSLLLTAFSSSNIRFSNALTLNIGLNAQVFTLNNNHTFEPRVALKWDLSPTQQFGVAYGLHSRLEKINYFFTKEEATGVYNNKDMGFTKSNHFVLSYSNKLSEHWLLKIEPYFQLLYDVPVIGNSYYSFINQKSNEDWFVNDKFLNIGKGRNYGVDVTLEKYFSKGFYMMTTASLFNSEYTGGDGIWRNTRYNKNYIMNFLAGKEWYLGENKQKIIGLNVRFTFQGGDQYVPYFEQASIDAQQLIYDYDNAFATQFNPDFILHFSANYKINRKKTTHEFALKILNATGYGDFQGFKYNRKTRAIDKTTEVIFIPNLSYKISF